MKAELAEVTRFLRKLHTLGGIILPEIQILEDGSGSFVQGEKDDPIRISDSSPFSLTHGKYLEFNDLDELMDIIKNQDAIISGGLQ